MSTFILWLTEYTDCQAFCLVVRIRCPHPLPRKQVWGGGRHTRLRGRGWGPNSSNEGTDTLVLYVYYDKAAFHVASKPNISGLFAGPSKQFLLLSFKTRPIESSANAKLLFLMNVTSVKDLCFTQQKRLAGTSET